MLLRERSKSVIAVAIAHGTMNAVAGLALILLGGYNYLLCGALWTQAYLVTSYFKSNFAFDTTGILEGKKTDEMEAFYTSLLNYGYEGDCPSKWMEAFNILRTLLEPKLKRERVVVFIDELPCFDTPYSGFIKALDYFWNSWASRQNNFFLVVCGPPLHGW